MAQHWIVAGVVCRSPPFRRIFPIGLFPTILEYPLGRSPVSLACPLSGLIIRKLTHARHCSTSHQTWHFIAGNQQSMIPSAEHITLCAHLRQITHFCNFTALKNGTLMAVK